MSNTIKLYTKDAEGNTAVFTLTNVTSYDEAIQFVYDNLSVITPHKAAIMAIVK